jgi:hypothetical protein
VARVSDFASSLGRPVYTGLKQMKGLAPHPWAVMQPTGQSLQWMRVYLSVLVSMSVAVCELAKNTHFEHSDSLSRPFTDSHTHT